MTPHEFEQRLQQCWDERRDPADDPEVCAWLLDHPDALEDFARGRATVAALDNRPAAPARPARLARLLLAAAAVAAAAALVLWPRPAPGGTPGTPGTARILSATLEVSRPQGHAAVAWREREVLCASNQGRLEIIQHRSERR